MQTLCNRLYDSATPREERDALQFEIAELRCRLARTRDPLERMIRGSGASDEED